MTEKEERIYVTKIQPECKFRELHETTAGGHTWVDFMCGKSTVKKLECDDKCLEQCEWKELTGISRQEAIERMAKALEEKSEQMAREYLNSDPYNNPWGAEDLAEAALNALLEGK